MVTTGYSLDFETRFLGFLAYDNLIYGSRASTLRERIDRVCKVHMLRGYPDPFGDHELLTTFLSSIKKLQKGKAPKFPFAAPLLKACHRRVSHTCRPYLPGS